MRIWILTSELPHEFAGGIARYVDNFARTLVDADHEVTVVHRTDGNAPATAAPGYRTIGVTPKYERLGDPPASEQPDEHPAYPYNVMSYWPAFSYQLCEEVLQLIEREGPPDVIECQEFAALPYYLLQRKLVERGPLEQVPIVVHMHSAMFDLMRINQEPRFRNPNYWLGQMERFSLVAADALLSPSAFLKDHILRTFRDDLDITNIPLPFIADYEAAPAEGTPGELVYVGRLEWRKGICSLIDVCAELWEAGREFRLTTIGGETHFAPRGCNLGDVIRKKHQRWIDAGCLNLRGQVKYTEVRELVRNAWAAVVPSHWENFPNTSIEAMAAGQLALVSRHGGQAEMVAEDGVNGFIFDYGRPGDLGRQLTRVLDLAPAERLEIAGRGLRRIASLCDPQTVLAQRLAHFERVIATHAPRAVFPTTYALADERPARPAVTVAPSEPETPGLISVIIPFYNLGDYIDETLASVRAADYSPREIIIVNDGSTDAASVAKIREIEARRLPDVRVIHTSNQGLAAARNNGVRAARGEFLALVDADDLIEPDFMARGVDVLHRYANVGFVFSWVRYCDAATGVWPTWNAEYPYLLGHNMLCVLTIVRRAAYLEAGGNDPAFAYAMEDYAGWVALLAAGHTGVSLPAPLVHYRIRPGSMRRQMNDDQALYLYDLLTQRFPRAFERWGPELFNLQNANGPGRLWNHPAIESCDAGVVEQQQRELEDLRHWVGEVERAKDWYEQRYLAAKNLVDTHAGSGSDCGSGGGGGGSAQEQTIAELRGWIDQLIEARDWHESQRQHFTELADHIAVELEQVRSHWWWRLGRGMARVTGLRRAPRDISS